MRSLIVIEPSLHVDAIDGIVDAVLNVSEVAHDFSGMTADLYSRKTPAEEQRSAIAHAAGRQIEATNVELPVLRPIDSEGDHAMERQMSDSTVKKVSSKTAPKGKMGQTYLASGKRLSMRIWENEPPQTDVSDKRDYETVGYVMKGRAELLIEGQTVRLEPGDSWLVPAHAEHSYRILEPFTAVEATAPPAQVHGRDE